MNHKIQNLPDCVMEIMLQWRICQVLSKKYFSPAQPQTLPSTMMEATEPNMLWEGEQKWSRFNNSSGHDLRADVGQQFQGLSNALLSHQMKSHPQLQCTKHGCRTLQMFLQIHTTYIYQVLLSDQALSVIQSLPLWSSRGFISNLATPKFYSNWDNVTAARLKASDPVQSPYFPDRKSEDKSKEGHQWTSKKTHQLRQLSSLEAGWANNSGMGPAILNP